MKEKDYLEFHSELCSIVRSYLSTSLDPIKKYTA